MVARVDAFVCCTLVCHPQTPCAVVCEVTAEIGVEPLGALVVGYRIVGDLPGLRVPDTAARLDPERLWAHTCCELFVAPSARDDYVEWNFSPSGQCTRFDFSSYRRRERASSGGVRPSVHAGSRELLLTVRVPLGPEIGDSARISLAAVLEDAAGRFSYWALRHPSERPDFHHRDGFVLSSTINPSPAITDGRVESP
jgi:hypothetical protein